MKKLSQLISLLALAAVFIGTSGCVQDYNRRYTRGYRYLQRSPNIASPDWLRWVDHKVDTRYDNGIRPDVGTQEWYAIVDHAVFADHTNDYYRGVYPDQHREYDRRYYGTRGGRYGYRSYSDSNYRMNRYSDSGYREDRYSDDYYRANRYSDSSYRSNRYAGTSYRGARYSDSGYWANRHGGSASRNSRSRFRLGSIEWKRAVDTEILSGRVPPPPPRSDPWDAPLAPTH